MNWFRQNRFLGMFFVALGGATLLALVVVWMAKSNFDEASNHFSENAAELSRLERLAPYPTESNVAKMKAQAVEYASALEKLKADLKTLVLPVAPLEPNQFQSQLRQAMGSVSEKARTNKVKLPDNFYLGFDEFASALPNTAAAPLLGQELAQVELLLGILIEARIDAITAFTRTPLPEEHGAAAAASPSAGRKPNVDLGSKMVQRSVVEVTFAASSSAARKALNQIASADRQFFVVRTLHVLNEKEKGPPRESVPETNATAAAPTASAKPGANPALNFIVGNEHIQTSARIEIVKFAF
ncbi:MAG: hypothetical protein QOI04_712 [Verrucomicrobiota bacterium]|jgi:hypothetical protein